MFDINVYKNLYINAINKLVNNDKSNNTHQLIELQLVKFYNKCKFNTHNYINIPITELFKSNDDNTYYVKDNNIKEYLILTDNEQKAFYSFIFNYLYNMFSNYDNFVIALTIEVKNKYNEIYDIFDMNSDNDIKVINIELDKDYFNEHGNNKHEKIIDMLIGNKIESIKITLCKI